ncbi:MAG: isoaspartyl peptidase/L-asparaginase family protein [Phycisphaerales bacterium]
MELFLLKASLTALSLACIAGCASGSGRTESAGEPVRRGVDRYAIAIHGGAGVIDRNAPEDERAAYMQSLEHALREGRDRLARGDSALDVCEAVVRILEDDPLFNAGKGAVFNAEGSHELDASIMDGSTLACGAVAGVRTVKNPISLARLVMERTPHVMLAGPGAEEFAAQMGVERVEPSYFDTPQRREGFDTWRERQKVSGSSVGGTRDAAPASAPKALGTVGCVALDRHGNLAAATSTGGMTGKRFGRVGDSPVIGAGTYASNSTCAVSCTGTGEEFIRHAAAFQVSAIMQYTHVDVEQAARVVIFDRLKPDDGGLIAVSHSGQITMPYSTLGMFRGAADSSGRVEVKIWE